MVTKENVAAHAFAAAYRDLGNDFTVDNGLLKDGLNAFEDFESVLRRWPLARKKPDESLGALRQAAKSLTIMLAGYMAEFVAETLQAILTFQGAPLTDEENIHHWARTTGFSPSIKSCCMRHQGTTRVYKKKGSDLAVGWSKL